VKVFVFGGTGAIGADAVPALVAAGHAVRALARSTETAARLRSHELEPVHGLSIFDREQPASACRGQDAVG
jgi:uncharacterized protein YbjT (DUF2867 family)